MACLAHPDSDDQPGLGCTACYQHELAESLVGSDDPPKPAGAFEWGGGGSSFEHRALNEALNPDRRGHRPQFPWQRARRG